MRGIWKGIIYGFYFLIKLKKKMKFLLKTIEGEESFPGSAAWSLQISREHRK